MILHRRVLILIAALGSALGLALAVAAPAMAADQAYVRLAHLSPDTPKVDVYVASVADPAKSFVVPGVGYGAATAAFTNRSGRASVLSIGPSSAFVVLNFGSARGPQLGQRLNVSQGTESVATVLISDVRTHFSIAQVQPDTLRGVLQKGDSAILVRSP